MKINIEMNFDDVNYDEIEEVDDITLYDSIDGWIDEPRVMITEGAWIDETISYGDTTAMDIMAKHMSYGIVKEDETDEDEEVYLNTEEELFDLLDEEEEVDKYQELIDDIFGEIRAAEDERYFRTTYIDASEREHFQNVKDAKVKVLKRLLPEELRDLI